MAFWKTARISGMINEMNKPQIAINGFGRIGRAFFRAAWKNPAFDIIALNDLGDPENLAYLLRYDTVYGRSDFPVLVKKTGPKIIFSIEGKEVEVLQEKDPKNLPWRDFGVDVVVESTGAFRRPSDARAHIDAGAKRVVVTAPFKDDGTDTDAGIVLIGVNEDHFSRYKITSNASCTTNAASPLIAILNETIGVEKAMLNTIHGYTSSQAIVDGPSAKDFRRGRAAAANIIPTTTGASEAVAKALPALEGNFKGVALRVPVLAGSLVDITFVAKRNTTAEEINGILKKAAKEPRWEKVFSVTEDPIVSSDIIGSPHASIADLSFTSVVGGNLVKVLAWYDNEMGYAHSLIEHVRKAGSQLT